MRCFGGKGRDSGLGPGKNRALAVMEEYQGMGMTYIKKPPEKSAGGEG